MSYHGENRASRRANALSGHNRYINSSHTPSSMYHHNSTFVPTSVMIHNIPLPPLASESISINPLLRYSNNPCILYDINSRPERAALSPRVSVNAAPEYDWRTAPALSPGGISSLTIRITGIDQPVVIVLPPPTGRPDSWGAYLTVWDVLKACYRAWSNAKHECSGVLQAHPITSFPPHAQSSRLLRTDNYSLHYNSSNHSNAMARMSYFQSSGIWAGLETSQTECDVWVLHTRPRRTGN
ncbi:hypothetical protein BJ165DRAFT_1608761 [Panaeolus papilionaceus]|nr:hypothetical protein BJ165DRAFT_1608761 [Panaeolus papilionaceus]